MKAFLASHQSHIHGVLSCFDRMLFRGYLPITSGWSMAQFLNGLNLAPAALKPFLLDNAQRVKRHAEEMAQQQGRPFEFLRTRTRMEDAARKMAQKDGIEQGLICIFAAVEACRSFTLRPMRDKTFVQSARRQCLYLYYYFMDQEFGLIHVKVQTWFPLQIQVYLNGHDWLGRKLTQHGVGFTQLDNVFLRVEDIARAQRFADRFANLRWPKILNRYAKLVLPQLHDMLRGFEHYWACAQSEYATDVMFHSPRDLSELYPRLLSHGTLCFGAQEVMNFLGRKLTGGFQGEVVSDLSSLVCRRTGGSRIKHRVKQNWLKMYDKAGLVLRVETVINNPQEFRVRKQVLRHGQSQTEWVQMRKGVAYLFRYREVCLAANARYLDALAAVDDPTPAKRALDRISTPKKDAAGRTCAAFNPIAKADTQLFQSILSGEHCLRGFNNQDIRQRLANSAHLRHCPANRQSAKVTRTLRRLRAHGLIAKIPRTRRWRVTSYGRHLMATAIYLREHHFANTYLHTNA